MLGAIVGDIVGSTFELQNHRSVHFELLRPECHFTDDTVCIAAMAHLLTHKDAGAITAQVVAQELRVWCCAHISRGYGSMFHQWLTSGSNEPYNSHGNGALMRMSPISLWAVRHNRSLEWTLNTAQKFTAATHGHKYALETSLLYTNILFNLLKDKPSAVEAKAMIRELVFRHEWAKIRSCDEYRIQIEFNVSARTSLLVALSAVLEATSFEECLRLVVSVGGDSDTYAAIAGALAEAIWGIPKPLLEIDKYFREYDKPLLEAVRELYA